MENKTVTITLVASADLTYDGNIKTVTVTQSPAGIFTDIPGVSYTGNRTDAGNHTASLTYGEVTANLQFTIEKATISNVAVDVTAPEAGAAPQTTVTAGTGYSASISWDCNSSAYDYNTAYTATVTLTADANHKFAGDLTVDGWTVSNTEGVLILTKTFAATRKAKLTALTGAPANMTLTGYHADANGAISELPATVTYTTESGDVTVAIQWTCDNYNSATKATNTFAWSVKSGELDACDENELATSGTITVTNVDALPVTNTGSDAVITYDGSTHDVSRMFTKDTNAGEASYTITGGTGEGALSGSTLTITKAGTIEITMTTAANDPYAAGYATATLTVNKAAGSGAVEITGWTYGEQANAPTIGGAGDVTLLYTGENYNSAEVPTDAGEYIVTVTFAETDLYKAATAADTFVIAQKELTATICGSVTKIYDGTNAVPAEHGLSIALNTPPGNDNVTASASYTYNGVNVGTTKITATGITLSGADAGNYKLKNTTSSADVGEITKAAAPGIVWPTAGDLIYGQTLSESTLTGEDGNGTFAWKNGNTVPTVTNDGYVVVYTPGDTDNYDYSNVELTKTITVTVAKAMPSVNVPTGLTATYGQTLADVKLPAGWTWDDSDTSLVILGSKGYEAVYTPADAENYNVVKEAVSVTVSPKALTDVTLSETSVMFDGKDHTPTVTVMDGEQTLTKDSHYTVTVTLGGETVTEVRAEGEYTITVTGMGNYSGTVIKTFTVTACDHEANTNADDDDCTTAVLCSVCGDTMTEARDSHTGGIATCAQLAECTVCHKAYGEYGDHNWTVSYYFAPDGKTCTATRACGNEAKHNVTVNAAISIAVKTEATCTEMGWSTYTAAFMEDWAQTQTLDVQDIPATGEHNYTTEVSRTEATCKATGSVTKKCVCGAETTETLPIDKDNHTKQNTTVKDAVAASCGAAGYTGDTYCECGEKIADGEAIPAIGHDMQQTSTKVEATCDKDGKEAVLTCANGCGKTEGGKTIPATGHTEETVPGKAATCTEPGLTDGMHCSVCKKVLVAQENVPVIAHEDADGDNKCDCCGAFMGAHIDHVFDQEKVDPQYLVREANCIRKAVYRKSCQCGLAGEETFTAGELKPHRFTDVSGDAYYHEPIVWAAESDITNGYGVFDIFAPDVACSRGQIVTFLWRAAGCPAPKSTEMPFKDVADGEFYTTAVLWAAENGITKGHGSAETFKPDLTCTRAEIITMLNRYLGGEATSNNNPFKDVPANQYYTEAVLWAAENGITNGAGDSTTFKPNATCTRGQTVTVLYRALYLN